MKTKIIVSIFLLAFSLSANCQQNSDLQMPKPKRFIDRFEIFIGNNFSFSYGNKFIENYDDWVIKNTRLLKAGYLFGLGLYHPINKRFDLNLRLQLEQKGTKAELNRPFGNSRQTITSEYNYNYTSVSLSPRYLIGSKENLAVSLGAYFAIINSVKGQEKYSDPTGGPIVVNDFIGRNWNVVDPDGAIRTWTFIPGLKSFNDYDYGLILGLSYQIKFTEQHGLLVQFIDQYGLGSVYNDKYSNNLLEKNHTISFLLAYTFYRKPLHIKIRKIQPSTLFPCG
ncbi:MAG: hypothetical protein ACKO1F_05365 [Flammeovirgaceae bacterium]